jgi:hypothetical protein
MKEHEEFEKIRQELNEDIQKLNKKIKYQRDLKKIKKEAFKNMIEGPPLMFGGPSPQKIPCHQL